MQSLGKKVLNLHVTKKRVCILGEEQAEVQLMSNMNADTEVPVQYSKALQAWTKTFAEEIMNHQVVNTDMKLRQILNKGLEVKKKKQLQKATFTLFLIHVKIMTFI